MAKNSAPSPDIAPALDQLTAEGLLWRGLESDRRAYNTLTRWREAAGAEMHARGWVLVHHEPLQTFQAVQRKGKHRRHLNRQAALCMLVLRLLRAQAAPGLTPHPAIGLGELAKCCAEFGFQPDLSTVLPELAALKLIRPAGGGLLRPTQAEQLLELLPTLEIVVPDSAIGQLAVNLQPTTGSA